MGPIRLIHWKAEEGDERAGRLRAAGYEVHPWIPSGGGSLRELAADPPRALVIDLSRLPSHGRDVGLALRMQKATRHIPLVFVDGEREKVARIRQLLPDATYTVWPRIRGALKTALGRGVQSPVVPESVFAAYAGRPLVTKLGIGKNCVVALVKAPERLGRTLGPLPEGVQLREGARGRWDLLLWFVRTRAELERGIAQRARATQQGRMWILWPKKRAGHGSDLTQQAVRKAGLDAGLVDYKIGALDETWSGLLFRRRAARGRRRD